MAQGSSAVVRVCDFVARAADSRPARWAEAVPWQWTMDAAAIVTELVQSAGPHYRVENGIAVHTSACVEFGALIKAPAFIGPNCFVASTALIRGGCWLDQDCIVGPSAELKTSFLFAGSKLAHLNFVGDSVLGADVNVEAGAMVANYRNERQSKRILIRHAGSLIDTGVEKFGLLAGDGVRIGANAVIAPGAILMSKTIVPRLTLVEQS